MKRAVIYLWPLMSKPTMAAEADKLGEAGYENAEKITITNRFSDSGKRIQLKVWRVM